MKYLWIHSLLFFLSTNAQAQVIDLTHRFDNQTFYWPGVRRFLMFIDSRGPYGPLPWYEGNTIEAADHGGTHVDAPSHLSEGKWRVDEIPPERLMGMGAVIDVKAKASGNRDYQITVQDVLNWEEQYGEIDRGSIVIFNTGWHQLYSNFTEYLGTDTYEAENFHFPGIHPDTAEWITNNRFPYAVGIDTPSLDYGQSKDYPAHRILFASNIYGIENVANVNKLSANLHMIYVSPMKIGEGSGAPTRVLATFAGRSTGVISQSRSLLVLFMIVLLNFV